MNKDVINYQYILINLNDFNISEIKSKILSNTQRKFGKLGLQ